MSKNSNKGPDSYSYTHSGLPATFMLNGGLCCLPIDDAAEKPSKIVFATTIGTHMILIKLSSTLLHLPGNYDLFCL